MVKLLLLLSVLMISNLFLLFRNSGRMGYLFSDVTVTAETWFYFLFEKLIVIVLALIILIDATEYRKAILVFIGIVSFDLVDYILFYSDPWFDDVPLSWNIVKVALFGSAILYEKYAK